MRMYLEPDGEARSVLDSTRGCDTTWHGKARQEEREGGASTTGDNLYVQYYCIRGGAEPASCRLHCGSDDGDGVGASWKSEFVSA